MANKKVFVIDGYGQIYRSYFAFITNPLKDKEGNNVSAVYGFFHTIMMLIRQYHPDYLVVALDSKGKTFRHELYNLYKANREKTPEDLHAQIPVITGILDKMNIAHYARVGMEADDIIATIAKSAENCDIETVMVTGDKDLLQLVRPRVSALRPPKKGEKEYRLCNEKEVEEIFGVRPNQIVDYLTILGDSSDNVPGIDGIGDKGAVKLLSDKDHIDDIYNNIESYTKSIQQKLEAARSHIELSKTLIILRDDLFELSDKDFENFNIKNINWTNAVSEFAKLGSDSLVKAALKFGGQVQEPKKTQSIDTLASSEKKLEQDSEQDSGQNLGQVAEPNLNLNDKNNLIGHGLKEKLKEDETQKAGFDIEIASWLLASDSSHYELEDICDKYLGSKDFDKEEAVRRLYPILKKELSKNGLDKVFNEIEMPLIPVLAAMEKEGIILDRQRLDAFRRDLEKECLDTEKTIYEICGHPFNINSPKQLQEVLFTERKLPAQKKTKNGYSTDGDVLQDLADMGEDPVPAMILRYRGLTKLLSTYVVALPQMINPQTQRIHTSFIQTGTATGRLSSKNPNLQNIPIRTEEGRRIRDAFVPKKGCILMSADYSQIELVVLAHLSQDKALMKAFEEGEDIHKATAALVFDIFPEMVTPQQRRMAKTINFGIMYGMSAFSLAHDLKISRKEAQNFIDSYFDRFSGVRDFIATVKAKAKEDRFVKTRLGHIRYIPEMQMSNKAVIASAERVAVNTVIQGTAAEIMKAAMIEIHKKMKEQNLKSKMLLQVHDEVIFEVPEEEEKAMKELVVNCMTNTTKLSIPLRVSMETGSTWGEMHQ